MGRALAEPPPPGQRADVLRDAARAEAAAGREMAGIYLAEALQLVTDRRMRAEIALEVAQTHAALFRWVDAVDAIERALAELDGADRDLVARLEGELVVCGLHDARRADRVALVLARLGSRSPGAASEPFAVAQAMAMLLAGRPAGQIAALLEDTLERAGPEAENWDTRAALLWVLVTAERFGTAEKSLQPMLAQVRRGGSARGFVAAYSTLGLLKLRLGALDEADAAARVALRVLQEGDFAPGLGFAATVLSDIAVEAGELDEAQALLEETLERTGPEAANWDTRAALLWVLVVAERFGTVEESLQPMLAQVHRDGSARGFVAAYSTLGLLKLRLGALDEADAAARVALRMLQEGDLAPGLGFAATVLSDIAVEAGQLGEAQALLDLLPQQGWPAGVGTVLIPAARGRLRLAQGRADDALTDFQACQALFAADVWGMPIRDTGYVHARSGAALALSRLGEHDRACELAGAELADVRVFGTPRALGIALRVAGLTRGGPEGLELLRDSVAATSCRKPSAAEKTRVPTLR